MKVALLKGDTVTSKKNGQEYRIYKGFSEEGEVVEMILGSEDVSKGLVIPESAFPSAEQLSDAFGGLPQVEVQFNNRGRVTGIEV